MQRDKVPHQPSQVFIPVVTIIHPTTKVQHPFDQEEKYVINIQLILENGVVEDPHITTEIKTAPYPYQAPLISMNYSKNYGHITPY